jgi:hypothetical protein
VLIRSGRLDEIGAVGVAHRHAGKSERLQQCLARSGTTGEDLASEGSRLIADERG